MRTLITGGAGFIGSHLADNLVEIGHELLILDDLSTGRIENVAHLVERPDVELVVGSVLDAELVEDVVNRSDYVFHLAAAVGVNRIIEQPLESLRTNVQGSEIVLEAASRDHTPVMVTSTSEIYGKNSSDRLREDDDRVLGSPLKSRWSYSTAKAIEEILAYTHWKAGNMDTVIVRLFNTVGPRQVGRYGMVLPRFIRQALRGDDLTVYGDGKQTRCFAYVGDVVGGMVRLSRAPEAQGEVFNLGGNDEISIIDLATMVIDQLESSSRIRFVSYDDAYDAGFEDMLRRVPDCTKAKNLVGFSPSLTVEQVIKMVADQFDS
jgi:UDP-glucose 4-epimerase